MQLTKPQAQENLSALLDKFQREWDSGAVKEYNEEATKTAFIQPLLKEVLGWDVTNRDEVSPEERTSRGRVDYGLKVAGKIKVFVEAKPIKSELSRHIEQAVGYGYNYKNVPFVLLTDFEGLKLFDVTVKPDARNPKKGLKLELSWVQYRSQFDKLWQLSRESVLAGELDKLLLVKPKDRVPVDKAILDDLKEWREDLAKEIFKHNRSLFDSGNREQDAQFLKEITQRLLDRLIFMRFCEDRKLTHHQSLKELFEERTDAVGMNTIVFLKEEFKHYNLIFDSDLFSPQEWENNLQLEFEAFKSIILGTYNPYQFDVIPLEVLGNIYEQYLGYTIRLTDQQVKYELKPDVRKAGGVYYTPEYIVGYIVQNTVGKLLQELPGNRIKKLRILDPACGSGSFLIRAYSEMLKYYLNQKKAEYSSVIARSPALKQYGIASLPLAMTTGRLEGGTTKQSQSHQTQLALDHQETEQMLTIKEKSRILREHIFGVDIDEQAVEVTKLSLMLKMLEGEYGIIPGRGILPMLDRNIKCGNSLISGSSLELKTYFGEGWYKVKPFNWDEQFKQIMVDEKGFDVVIGNPPYVRVDNIDDNEKKYYSEKYKTVKGKYDIYYLFIEKSLKLLSQTGSYGMIVPNRFCTSDSGLLLRNIIIGESHKVVINSVSKLNIFEGASNYPVLLFIKHQSKREKSKILFLETKNKDELSPDQSIILSLNFSELSKIPNSIFPINVTQKDINIFFKASQNSQILSKYLKISEGFRIPVDLEKPNGDEHILKQYQFSRYSEIKKGAFIDRNDRIKNISDVSERYTNCLSKKIVFAEDALRLETTIDLSSSICQGGVYFAVIKLPNTSIYFLLGILNSSLLTFIYKTLFGGMHMGGGYLRFRTRFLEHLPVYDIDFSKPAEKKLHDDLVGLVEIMLDLNQKLRTAKGSELTQLEQQIAATDREIDTLVYTLYGITDQEKAIIEGT